MKRRVVIPVLKIPSRTSIYPGVSGFGGSNNSWFIDVDKRRRVTAVM